MKIEVGKSVRGAAESIGKTSRAVGTGVARRKTEAIYTVVALAIIGVAAAGIARESEPAIQFNPSISEKTTDIPSGLPSKEAYDKAVQIIIDIDDNRKENRIIYDSVAEEARQFRSEYAPDSDINKSVAVADTRGKKILLWAGFGFIALWIETYLLNPFHWKFLREAGGGILEGKLRKAKPLADN